MRSRLLLYIPLTATLLAVACTAPAPPPADDSVPATEPFLPSAPVSQTPADTVTHPDVISAQEALTPTVMALAGVVGTAVAECDGEPCIKVYLATAAEEVAEKIPADFGGFPVVTEVTGEVRKRNDC